MPEGSHPAGVEVPTQDRMIVGDPRELVDDEADVGGLDVDQAAARA
jgi:hypothetical protein